MSETSKTPQYRIDKASAWNKAHPERRREISLKSYLKLRPPLKPVLTVHERFDRLHIPVTESGCWLWLGAINRNGYGKVKLDRKHWTAHRWAWQLFRGDLPDSVCVLHRCDVRSCVNPDHLFLGTVQDNVDDMWRKGRRGPMRGGRAAAKLTDHQVSIIRSLRGNVRQIDLAIRFNIHHSQISRIQNGKYYKHTPFGQGRHEEI